MTTRPPNGPAAALAGVLVVVTRPEKQAAALVAMLRERGASTVSLPALRIEPIELGQEDRARLAPDRYDWAIYLSANAVEQSLIQLATPSAVKIAAVGKATARKLSEHGLTVHSVPETSRDSEGLLQLPQFASVAGQRILLLRGVGGRALLRDELSARGASVAVAELYRRELLTASAEAIDELRRQLGRARRVVVAVTSVAIIEGLLHAVPEDLATHFRGLPLLVPGDRVAAAARGRGWSGRLIVARSAEDSAMLESLIADETRRRSERA